MSIARKVWRHVQIPAFMGAYALAIRGGVEIGTRLHLSMTGLFVVGLVIPAALALLALRRMRWI